MYKLCHNNKQMQVILGYSAERYSSLDPAAPIYLCMRVWWADLTVELVLSDVALESF